MAQDHSKCFLDLKFALILIKNVMKKLESSLKKVPLDEESLRIQLDDVVPIYWSRVTECYDHLGDLTQVEQAKIKPIVSGELRALYDDLLDRAGRALEAMKVVKESTSGETISKKKPKKKNRLREAI